MMNMKKSIFVLVFAVITISCFANVVKSSEGAKKMSQIAQESGGSTAALYVQDGLIAMYDGIENAGWGKHDATATYWVDLINNVKWNNMAPYMDGMRACGANSCTPSIYHITSDFTLKGALVNVNASSWRNWTAFALSKDTTAYHPGIGLKQADGVFSVTYRTAYAGPILASVNTKTHFNEAYSVTIVFHYEALSFDVYVRDQLMGSAQISLDDWTIQVENLVLGNMFYSFDYIGDFRLFNVMLYYRALSAEEITHNWLVDQERYGL